MPVTWFYIILQGKKKPSRMVMPLAVRCACSCSSGLGEWVGQENHLNWVQEFNPSLPNTARHTPLIFNEVRSKPGFWGELEKDEMFPFFLSFLQSWQGQTQGPVQSKQGVFHWATSLALSEPHLLILKCSLKAIPQSSCQGVRPHPALALFLDLSNIHMRQQYTHDLKSSKWLLMLSWYYLIRQHP